MENRSEDEIRDCDRWAELAGLSPRFRTTLQPRFDIRTSEPHPARGDRVRAKARER